MKITKAQGRACLESADIPPMDCHPIVKRAWTQMGWATEDEDGCLFDRYHKRSDHYFTVLAMCAAIAGVKP